MGEDHGASEELEEMKFVSSLLTDWIYSCRRTSPRPQLGRLEFVARLSPITSPPISSPDIAGLQSPLLPALALPIKLRCRLNKMAASPLSPKLDNTVRYQQGLRSNLYVILLSRLP